MHLRLYRPLLALLLSSVLACAVPPAQGAQSPSKSDDWRTMVKPDPKRAKKLAELAARAEEAGDYEGALAAYEEAARYAPFDVTIVSKGAALRSSLVRRYVEDAERLTLDSNFLGAAQQLAGALHIDPANPVLLERLKQVEAMRPETLSLQSDEPPEGLPILVPEKIRKDFHFQSDVRGAYDQVAAAYGIKVSFDPDLPSRNVKLRLEDVDFATAMKVLMIESGTFWSVRNPKQIFVAADTSEKRKAYDPVIEQTFVLPESTSPTELTDVVRAVRELTGAQRVQQSLAAHSVTMRDTVARVNLAGAVIKDLEKAHGEVLLEIDLLEVDRNAARKLGITPPASTSFYSVPPNLASALRTAPTYTALLTLLASIFGTVASGGLTSLATAIPPIVAIGGGKTTFLLSLPSVSADFSDSLSLVHSGRQVLMRAQDGKPATFFVGERYPITLSLLSGSLGSSGLTPNIGGTGITIQTEQFTVGRGPVSVVSADFRGSGNQDLAVLNQVDNSISILLNQGAGVATQFAAATGSPFSLGPAAGSGTTGIVSPAASLTVTSATLKSITVTPASVSLAAGGTQQFTATGTFSDGSIQDISSDVSWTSSNTAIATIRPQTGLSSCVGPGTTQITATLGTLSSTAVPLIGTTATLESIAVTPATASLARNGTEQFTATGTFSDASQQNVSTTATWSSSNANAASIGPGSGLARGVNAGSSQIKAALGSVTSPSVLLTVTSATLKSIAVAPATAAVAAGSSIRFVAVGTYSDGSTQDVSSSVLWVSSKAAVGTVVASSGLATGVTAGTTSITAAQGGAGTPAALAVGSLNANTDSLPDLLVASQATNTVAVLLGNGDGTFTNPNQAVTYVVGNQPTAIAVGTFNSTNNANLGFVVTNFADNSYSVFTGNADGTFSPVNGSPFRLPAGQTGPVAVTVADFNADGKADLAILNQSTNNVTVLEGNGDGTFLPFAKSPLAVGNSAVAITSGTLDGSTGPALAIANQGDNTLTVYLGNGDGTFFTSSQSPLATSSAPSGVVIADLVGTSSGAIAVTNRDSGTLKVFLDLGGGLFTDALEPAAGSNPGDIIVGNFTGSTFPDLVVTNNISGSDGQVTLLVSPTSVVSGSTLTQQAYPGAEYEDIGLKIKATPSLHANNEVTLQLDYEIKAISGANLNGIPVISNRSVTQTIRLKQDETSIVTGLLDQEETKALTGIPGFAQIPGAGYLFGSHNNSNTDTELLILITPRTMRIPVHDARSVYAGRGDMGGRGAVGTAGPPVQPATVEPEEPRPENPPAIVPGQVIPGPPAQQPPPQQQPPQEQPNPDNPPAPPPVAPPPTRPEQ